VDVKLKKGKSRKILLQKPKLNGKTKRKQGKKP